MSYSVEKDTDPGFQKLQSIIKEISLKGVKAGYIEGKRNNKREKGKVDNVTIAVVQNLGSVKAGRGGNTIIPPRPTMVPAFDENINQYVNAIDILTQRALASGDKNVLKNGLGQVGTKMKQDIQQKIRQLTTPALAEATIDNRKRSLSKGYAKGKSLTKPLIWGGEYINATTYEIIKE